MALFKFLFNSRSQIFFSFGAIQAMQLALPLVAYPWLARKLGAEAFGLLMYMALIPSLVNLVMDWGLSLAATRAAAKNKSRENLGSLVSQVLSAKLCLLSLILFAGALLLPLVPHAREWPLAYFLAIGCGIARGLNPIWFFQGIGRHMKKIAAWDVASTLLALLLMLFLVKTPEDWQLYLLLFFLSKGCAWLWLNGRLWLAYDVSFSLKAALELLKHANLIFLSFIFSAIYLNGSRLALGFFLSVASLGELVAASKMGTALASLAKPLAQTIFPQICGLALDRCGPKRMALSRKILFLSLSLTFFGMTLVSLLVWFMAPWIIKIALGPDFQQTVPILRAMAWAVPLMACNTALGEQFLVAWGWEKTRAWITGIAALTSLVLAMVLPLAWGIMGAAWLPLCVEALISLLSFLALWLKAGSRI